MKSPLRRLAESGGRISTQLYAGIGAAVAITMLASLVAWFSFNRVGDAQSRINERSVPEMAASFRIAQQAGDLVAAAPMLVAAATQEELAGIRESIDGKRAAFEDQLRELQRDGAHYDRINEHGRNLVANINAIEEAVDQRFALEERSRAVRDELAQLQRQLDRVLTPVIDDQLFYVMTGYRDLGQPPAVRDRHLAAVELARYRHLAGLQADSNIGTQLLASVFNIGDAASLDPPRDRFQAAIENVQRRLAALGAGPAQATVAPTFARLRDLGLGTEGGFQLREQELALDQRQQALLAANRELATQLVYEVQELVDAAEDSAGTATQAATAAIGTGRGLLLGLNGVSIVGAVLVAWLFVGRVLLRRIERLAERMRTMAGGDLEAPVDIDGQDEVADMAAALEVFRRHALEVQRLNLVEKLADELRDKNDLLESTLDELRHAQGQIVAREKLAALGQLTAGIAHEIKNPLNFVKNFSEASEELLDELKEILEEVQEGLADEQRDLVAEIRQDLVDNLGRIRNHGNRADRIVRDMLMMGRGGGDKQPADLNQLLEEHVRLAFHSARATDSDFQLRIEQDLDPTMGQIDVVPQDLARVFLNMVTNACYATDQRRRARKAEDPPYEPTLRIATRRLADHVEIRIRDNGTGIPADVVDKIFNPFFTTKPTDQGTGLGLALSNDIVREHGGVIQVKSEPDSFTEMRVEIPLVAPTATDV